MSRMPAIAGQARAEGAADLIRVMPEADRGAEREHGDDARPTSSATDGVPMTSSDLPEAGCRCRGQLADRPISMSTTGSRT